MIEWVVTSSILIGVIIALRYLLRGKISLRIQYALWGLVLLRLLIPFNIGGSRLSVMNTAEKIPVVQDAKSISNVDQIEHMSNGSVEGYYPSDFMCDFPKVVAESKTAGEYARMKQVLSFREAFIPIWLCGTVALFIMFAASNGRFSSQLRRTRRPLEVRGSALPIYITGETDTPCLFGLFRPAIYVTPEAAEDATILRHTVEHETTHFRHGDNFWSVLRVICLAVHWYNPLVWWAAFLSRRDAELACDEATINRLGERERAEYGRTLIGMTCQKRTALPITATTMTGSKSSIRERIMLLAKKPKMKIYTLIAVVLAAAVAVGCTFTGSKRKGDARTEIAIQVASQAQAPDAVVDYAKDYVRQAIEYYAECGANPPDGYGEYKVTDSKITGITQINTGTAGLDNNISLYKLEYRLLPDYPNNVALAEGTKIEDGWITEWGSMGQPYLLLFCDESGAKPVWDRICVTNTDVITQDYGTAEMLAQYGDAYTAAAMELYQKYVEETTANSAALTDIFTTLKNEQTHVQLTLTTDDGSTVAGTYSGWGCGNDVQLSSSLLDYTYAAVSPEEFQTAGIMISLVSAADGDDWSINFYDGSDFIQLIIDGTTTCYQATPVYEGSYPVGTILRMWYDEAEFQGIGGNYETQGQIVIPDEGQDYLTAAKEYCEAFEGKHLIATPGSEFCYTYVSCQTKAADDFTANFRETGEIYENTYAFYLTTVFVPENERALNFSMAGNTGKYTGTDPNVPEGAYEYGRCGYITRSNDGWQGNLVGTGW